MGIGVETARRAVEQAARMIPTEDAAEQKKLMLAELDQAAQRVLAVMIRKHVHVTQGGKVVYDDGEKVLDDAPILAAVDRLIRLQERRCRMMGLDAPRQDVVTVITEDAVDAEIARLEKLLALND
jgi:hypothetical protein